MLSEIYWRSVNFLSLQIEEWNGEFTIFQPDSGKTHFLNQMGLQVILNLNQVPATEDEIGRILAQQFQQVLDQELSLQINKILHRFDALGLIEKVRFESSS